jgi:hypothetical protein
MKEPKNNSDRFKNRTTQLNLIDGIIVLTSCSGRWTAGKGADERLKYG